MSHSNALPEEEEKERGQEGGGRVVRTVGSSQLLSLGGLLQPAPLPALLR